MWDWAKKAAIPLALGASLLGGTASAASPSSQPASQPSASQPAVQNGLQRTSDGNYVFIQDDKGGSTKALEMIAKDAYMKKTGSNMQGVQWGVKKIGGKVGVWFKAGGQQAAQQAAREMGN